MATDAHEVCLEILSDQLIFTMIFVNTAVSYA
jgi:hypothetical protein